MEIFEIVNLYNDTKGTLYYVLYHTKPLSAMLIAYKDFILQLYNRKGILIKEFSIASIEDATDVLKEELLKFLFMYNGDRG